MASFRLNYNQVGHTVPGLRDDRIQSDVIPFVITYQSKFDFAPYSGPRIALFSRVSEMVARIFANPSDSGGVEKLEFAWFPWLF